MCQIRLAETSVDSIVESLGRLYRSAIVEPVTVLLSDDSRIEILPSGNMRFERRPGERKAVCTEVLERLHTMGVFD
jgi:hypothetical protein